MIANIISTHRCNLRCKHCYYIDNLQIEDDNRVLQNWELLLSKCDALDIEKINFTGGEASISPHISKFFFDCTNHVIPFSIFSNGIAINDIILDLCNEYYLSIDGVDLIHDNIRNYNGAYQKMYSTLCKIKKQKKVVHIQTTINKFNIDSLSPLLKLYSEFVSVIKSISLVAVINRGNTLSNNLALSNEDFCKIKAFKEMVLDTTHYHIFVRDNLYTTSQIKEFVLSFKSTFPIWIDIVSGVVYVMNEKYKTTFSSLSQEWIQEQYELIRNKISDNIKGNKDNYYIIEELV